VAEPTAESRCERCGGAFHCGVNDAAPCACTTVTLDAATLAALRRRYEGCLCLRCLAELAAGAALSPNAAADGR
jgi:ribosomal protein L34E